ncbi:uncharacterized protein Z520_05795 [Fonsecaea multimorphosa CBS 102226]|uniref:Stress-response A/B barrel domain-containing protein n=1 Tax=Fonsecaea multimorphosa CBS 102226 TaxID=1442371 RepID=A0A0D2K5R3_9EURO|nr:uncharacterized protein Z520_05795 [Fonsecaea multimorphosa CBS 102226]KIX98494.1 hypothetical protein Z520_05795 [Fonsecaea multimorphosa CBS 102226]
MATQRMTFFKVFDPEAHNDDLIEKYNILRETNKKDGKPYIRSIIAKPTIANRLDNGYNFVAITTFDSLEDLEFYDKECPAHKKLKEFSNQVTERPPQSVWIYL